MVGHRLSKVIARRPDLRFPLPKRFTQRLGGVRIDALARRGKHLLAGLDSGETLVMHLGMSGRFTIEDVAEEATAPALVHARSVDPRHDHVVFRLDSGATVTFNDPRRFGYMRLHPTLGIEDAPPFDEMGPEPLSNQFSAGMLEAAFANRRTAVKAALLDQRIVAGLGNIYVCEALFRARIDPRRQAGAVTSAQAGRLAAAVRDVLVEAIDAGGSSLRDYAKADGSLGYFQHAFQVYRREGDPCPRERCRGVLERIVQSGRSTFLCPRCQR